MEPDNTATPTVDPVLAMLVQKIQRDAGIHVTLIVRGVAISGHLIAAHDYYKAVEWASLAGNDSQPIRDEFGKLHRTICDGNQVAQASADAAPFFHLKDATVAGVPVRFWRGRLTAVDAFALEK